MKLTQKFSPVSSKRAVAWLATFSLMQLLAPLAALAAPPVPSAPSAPVHNVHTVSGGNLNSLDLTSTQAVTTAGQLPGFHNTNVVAGGVLHSVNSQTPLTASGMLAVLQALSGTPQSLNLNGNLTAAGGIVSLTQPTANVASMVVPHGVTVIDHLDTTANVLNLTGNLTNSGNIFVAGTGNASLAINATNIYNMVGGVIASLGHSNLTLNAVNDITNAGTIYSHGTLTLNAGNNISNYSGGVVHAGSDVNLSAGSGVYQNNGQIIADTGNINFLSPSANANITLNGLNGALQALLGDINFRDSSYQGLGNVTLNDGDFFSNNLNIYDGNGFVTANVGQISGTVNLYANGTKFNSDTANLNIGTWCLTGDPYITNTGNIDISSLANAGAYPGQEFVVIAGGNITANSGLTINTSGANFAGLSGGNVVMIAGAGGPIYAGEITGASGTGGDINISNLTINTAGGTSATVASAGGSVTLAAYSNNLSLLNGAGQVGGHVLLPGSNINTVGNLTGANGAVTVVAEASSNGYNTPTTVNLGTINTTNVSGAGSNGTGSITISTSAPNTSSTNYIIVSGAGTISGPGSLLGGSPAFGVVSTGALTTLGAPISITSGTNANAANPAISTGALTTSSASGAGGAVTLSAGQVIPSSGSDISVAGDINTSSTASTAANAGAVTIMSPSNVTVANVISTSTNGNGGNVNIFAAPSSGGTAGTITFQSVQTNSTSTQSGASGNVLMVASSNINSVGAVNTSAPFAGGTAGNVTLVAGGLASSPAGPAVTVSASPGGGNIYLSQPFGNAIVTAAGTTGTNATGGNVNLAAYGSGTSVGDVTVKSAIDTSGSGTGTSGNVNVVAGGASSASSPANPVTLVIGSIITSRATGSLVDSGNVALSTSVPGPAAINISTGAITAGSFTGGAAVAGAVSVQNITTAGGNVSISAGHSAGVTPAIQVQSINTSATNGGTSAVGNGGAVSLVSGADGASSADISVAGSIVTTGSGASNSGGTVSIVSPSSVSFSLIDTGDSASAIANANGGNVLVHATNSLASTGAITFGQVTTNGVSGGNVTMVAAGNITSATGSAPVIDTSAKSSVADLGNGGNVSLVAGALASVNGSTESITGSSSGGNILFSQPNAAINTATTVFHGSGGSVLLAAYSGVGGGGTVNVSGDITTNGTLQEQDVIARSGVPTLENTWSGYGGNVFIVAGGVSANSSAGQWTINVGNINTTTGSAPSGGFVGGAIGSGNVNLITAQPNSTGIQLNNGSIVSGNFLTGSFAAGAVQTSAITTSGGSVTIRAGSNAFGSPAINTGSINTSVQNGNGVPANGSGGAVTLAAGESGSNTNSDISVGNITTTGFTNAAVTGFLFSGQSVTSNIAASTVQQSAGQVTITTPGNISVSQIDAGDSTSATTTGNQLGSAGGNVLMLAGSSTTSGSITVTNSITTQGAANSGEVLIASLGTASSITIGSITTDATKNLNNTGTIKGGPVTISSATGLVSVGSISAQGSNHGGDVLISDGDTSASSTVSMSSINTSASATGTPGDVFVLTLSGAAAPSITTITEAGQSSKLPGLIAMAATALPTGSGTSPNTLNFVSGSSSQAAKLTATNTSGTSITPFFSPGGYASVNDSGTYDIAFNGTGNNLIIPVVSLNSNGVQWTQATSSVTGAQAEVAFMGSSVDLGGTGAGSGIPISTTTSAPVSAYANSGSSATGVIINASGATGATNLGSIVSPRGFTFVGVGDLNITRNIVAPTTTISLTSSTPTYNGKIVDAGTIETNALNVNIVLDTTSATGAVTGTKVAASGNGTVTGALNVISGTDPLVLTALQVGSIALSVSGNILVVPQTVTGNIVLGAAAQANSNAALQLETIPTGLGQGNIVFSGELNAQYGHIDLVAAGGIYTNGVAALTAIGNYGTNGHTGGNAINLFAGSNSFNSNSNLSITGRSGIGGDIVLSSLSTSVDPTLPGGSTPFQVTTDQNPTLGDIVVAAFANVAPNVNNQLTIPATITGGNIKIDPTATIFIFSPNVNGFGGSGFNGITLVGEAGGGPSNVVTISAGNLYSGVGAVNIQTATPNINPIHSQGAAAGTASISNASGAITVAFGNPGILSGTVQSNDSVSVGWIGLDGSGANSQQVDIISGGSVTTGAITTIGQAGYNQPPSSGNSAYNAKPGGSGANITISSSFDIAVNGSILAFGGGGGGGGGDPYVNDTPGTPRGGGTGGQGGNGGAVSLTVNDAGSILVNGDINTSGGGGGGGGGGAGGNGISISSGGAGGNGGSAGNISLTAAGLIGSNSTVTVTGQILAVAGGNGGHGGNGSNGASQGGSGGGGGGSYGGGGGGGAGGASEPNQTNSGVAGAGGGGALGGAGGDIANTGFNAIGGTAGGAFLNNNYLSGAKDSPGPVLNIAGNSGNGTSGGNGGTYSTFTPSIGGIFGMGGQAGQPIGTSSANVTGGQDVFNSSNGKDGMLVLTGPTITSPSKVTAGGEWIETQSINGTQGPSTGSITLSGTQLLTGNVTLLSNQIAAFQVGGPVGVTGYTQGNVIVSPNTTIDLYNGEVLINTQPLTALTSATASITIGANSTIFAAGSSNATTLIGVGQIPTTNGQPLSPSNNNPVGSGAAANADVYVDTTSSSQQVFFGSGGVSATGALNVVYSLGSVKVIFQTPVGKPQLITLSGGDQIGSQSAAPLTSLDFADSSSGGAASKIISLQSSHIVGGTLFKTGNNITGGTAIFVPINLRQDLTAFNIPTTQFGLNVTFNNFAASNPIRVDIGTLSTSQNVNINAPVTFATFAFAPAANISVYSGLSPTLTVGSTGSLTSTGSLSLANAGNISFSGPVSVYGGPLNITTTAGGGVTLDKMTLLGYGNINVSSQGSVTIGVTGTTLLEGLANVSIVGSGLNILSGATGGFIYATGGSVTLNNSNAAGAITVGNTPGAGLNITTTMLSQMFTPSLIVGSMSNTGGIQFTNGLDTSSFGNPQPDEVYIGAKNLTFLNGGNINNQGTNHNFLLGYQTLTMNAGGTLTVPSMITYGTGVSLTSGQALNLTPLQATGISLLSGNVVLASGTNSNVILGSATVQAPGSITVTAGTGITNTGSITQTSGALEANTITLNAGSGGIPILTANGYALGSVQTLVINSGGTAVVSSNAYEEIIASGNVNSLTLINTSPYAGSILMFGGPLTVSSSLTATQFTASTANIYLQGLIFAGAGTVNLTAPGSGYIYQVTQTGPSIIAGTANLLASGGSVGFNGAPIQVGISNLHVQGSLTAGNVYMTDSVPVALNGSNTGLYFNLTDSGQDTVSAPAIKLTNGSSISGYSVTLNASNATAGSIVTGSSTPISTAGLPTAYGPSSTITLISSGNGGPGVTGGSLLLNSSSINQSSGGTLIATSGSGGMSATVNAPFIILNGTGATNVTDSATGTIVLGGYATGGVLPNSGGSAFTFNASGASNLEVLGSVTATNVTLLASNLQLYNQITATGTTQLAVTGTLTTVSSVGVAGGGTLSINAPNSSLGSISNFFPVNITGENVLLSPTGGLFEYNSSTSPMNVITSTVNGTSVVGLNVGTGTAYIIAPGGVAAPVASPISASSLTLSSSQGSLGTVANPLYTAHVSNLTVSGSAGANGTVNINNTNAGLLTLNTSYTGLALSVTTSGSMTVAGVVESYAAPSNNTTNLGQVTLTAGTNGATSSLNVNAGQQIIAVGGGIQLMNNDTTTGTINIGAGAYLHTVAYAPNFTKSTSVGLIQISIGAPGPNPGINPLSNGVNGIALIAPPAGSSAAAYGGGSPNAVRAASGGTAYVYPDGSNVIFNSPGGSQTITLGNGSYIQADPIIGNPPSGGSLVAPPVVAPSGNSGMYFAPAAPAASSATNAAAAPNVGQVSAAQQPAANATFAGMSSSANTAISPAQTVSGSYAINAVNAAQAAGINAAEFENVVLFDGSNIRAGIESNTSAPSAVRDNGFEAVAYVSTAATTTLHNSLPLNMVRASVPGVDAVAHSGSVKLRKGSILMAPNCATTVSTPFGTVEVGARAVALVVVTGNSVAVYNFHDEHAGDVVASVGDAQVQLAPGHHVLLTNAVAQYDVLNPLSCVGHRGLHASSLGSMRSYASEFSIMSALQGLRIWNELKGSTDHSNAHLVETVLKDAAIIVQTRGGNGSYHQYKRSADKLALAQ